MGVGVGRLMCRGEGCWAHLVLLLERQHFALHGVDDGVEFVNLHNLLLHLILPLLVLGVRLVGLQPVGITLNLGGLMRQPLLVQGLVLGHALVLKNLHL